ncbi:MAG: outer membrane lipoprotein carrier protein LolA [Candidatus Aminicenantaceae bacterium]
MKLKNILIVLFCFIILVKPAFPLQNKKLDIILDKLEKKYNTTDALFCQYEQTEKISQLTEDIHLEGKLYFRKPHFVMMEMRGDENLNLYVNGEKIWIEDLDLDEVEIIDFHQLSKNSRLSKLLPPFFLLTVEELKELFNISLITTKNGKNRLELSPRSAGEFKFKSFQFNVDEWGRIPWMKLVYDEENFKEIRFRGWKKIPKTSKYFFQYRENKKEKEKSHKIVNSIFCF